MKGTSIFVQRGLRPTEVDLAITRKLTYSRIEWCVWQGLNRVTDETKFVTLCHKLIQLHPTQLKQEFLVWFSHLQWIRFDCDTIWATDTLIRVFGSTVALELM